jgi:hypothetical protein
MALCSFKHALGRPGEGVHAARIGRFAAFDVVGTVVIGVVIAYATCRKSLVASSLAWTAALLLLGLFLHWLFCVPTAMLVILQRTQMYPKIDATGHPDA